MQERRGPPKQHRAAATEMGKGTPPTADHHPCSPSDITPGPPLDGPAAPPPSWDQREAHALEKSVFIQPEFKLRASTNRALLTLSSPGRGGRERAHPTKPRCSASSHPRPPLASSTCSQPRLCLQPQAPTHTPRAAWGLRALAPLALGRHSTHAFDLNWSFKSLGS